MINLLFQESLDVDMASLGTLAILGFLMILFSVLAFKYRIWVVLLPIYLFSVILGVSAFEVETPLSPHFEILFMLYINVVFFWVSWNIFTGKRREFDD